MIRLDRNSSVPLYRQIAESLRESISSGATAPASRLPSSRTLAQSLQVSRNTVLSAYAELASWGLVTGRIGSGTRVAGRARSIRRPRGEEIVARSGYPRAAMPFTDSDGNGLYIRRR